MIWLARLVFFLTMLRTRLFRRRKLNLPEGETGKRDSEAAAEVVRVTEILPHGNADTLEVVKFEMAGTGPAAYEVVCKKGDFFVGNLAAYFSVDCVVPVKGWFAFLDKRPDGANKTHFRLRAARLRGRYSQGLLLNGWEGPSEFGGQLWDSMGVTYHRPPEPGEPVVLQGKKPRPQPMPVYGVDSLKKVPNLFDGCERLFVTEKIHGTNFRFGWVRRRVLGIPVGWRFVVGSHRAIKGEDATGPGWYGEDPWTEFATRNDLAYRTKDHKGHVFFGELYGHTYTGKAIQDLTYGRGPADGPGLALFDVLGPHGWLEPEERYRLFESLGLPGVPIVRYAGPEYSSIEALAEGQTLVPTAPRGHIREGVVVESIGVSPRLKAKYVSQAYHLRKEAP